MKCQQLLKPIGIGYKIYVSPTANEKLKVRQIRCASKYITGRYFNQHGHHAENYFPGPAQNQNKTMNVCGKGMLCVDEEQDAL